MATTGKGTRARRGIGGGVDVVEVQIDIVDGESEPGVSFAPVVEVP